MWQLLIASCLALAATAVEGNNITGEKPANLPAPITTRQSLFSIPFRLEQQTDPLRQPTEVQLFVSHDNGANWNFYTKTQPNQKNIPFRTGTDGEYWFAVRTVDKSGQTYPDTIPGPGLRVIVDTTPPRMQLNAQCGQAGQIIAQWQITDSHLKPESLTLQYRLASDGLWQTVAIGERNSTVSGSEQTGEVSWWPQPGSSEVQIRAEITDSAGNKSVSHAQVKIGRDTSPKPGYAAKPIAEGASNKQADFGIKNTSADAVKTADLQPGAVSQPINPAIANRYQGSDEISNDADFRQLPPGERPRMINSKMFELDYDMESVGTSGVSRVELWGTRDGGRTWRMFTVDDDNRSPISVSVDLEGIYGFRIVATSGAGLSEQSPKSGDLPSIWVGVDLTKPVARILNAELGKDANEGKMGINWEASDKLLADRPVTLSFSQNRGGPWTTIATGLENTGRYDWTIDNRVPPKIFLRLEVRDEAGNLSVQEYGEPVALDKVRPTAKIREVRPVVKSGKM